MGRHAQLCLYDLITLVLLEVEVGFSFSFLLLPALVSFLLPISRTPEPAPGVLACL